MAVRRVNGTARALKNFGFTADQHSIQHKLYPTLLTENFSVFVEEILSFLLHACLRHGLLWWFNQSLPKRLGPCPVSTNSWDWPLCCTRTALSPLISSLRTLDSLSSIPGNNSLYCASDIIVMAAPMSNTGLSLITMDTLIGGVVPPPTMYNGSCLSFFASAVASAATYFVADAPYGFVLCCEVWNAKFAKSPLLVYCKDRV